MLASLFQRAETLRKPSQPKTQPAEPVVGEAAVTGPVPAERQPAELEAAEPVLAEPVLAEPEVFELEAAEPVLAEPVLAEPEVFELEAAEPVLAEPVRAELEPVEPEVFELEPVEPALVALSPQPSVLSEGQAPGALDTPPLDSAAGAEPERTQVFSRVIELEPPSDSLSLEALDSAPRDPDEFVSEQTQVFRRVLPVDPASPIPGFEATQTQPFAAVIPVDTPQPQAPSGLPPTGQAPPPETSAPLAWGAAAGGTFAPAPEPGWVAGGVQGMEPSWVTDGDAHAGWLVESDAEEPVLKPTLPGPAWLTGAPSQWVEAASVPAWLGILNPGKLLPDLA
jgi:hypothetical protein